MKTNYALYLAKKLIGNNAKSCIVVKKFLKTKDGYRRWLEDHPHLGDKKCCIIGASKYTCNFASPVTWLNAFTNEKDDIYKYSIEFSYEWDHFGTEEFCLSDIEKNSNIQQMMDTVFLQLMAISERKDIWFDEKVLFKKNDAYMHLLEAELQN